MARYQSGFTKALAGNPYWNHIKNIDPRLRADHGYVQQLGSWWYPGHRFDATASLDSTELAAELRDQIASSIDRLTHEP